MGASPSSRHGLGPMFLLGGARLSGHGAGEQMLLLVGAFWQESCSPGLLLSSLGLSPKKTMVAGTPPSPQQYLPKQKAEVEGPPNEQTHDLRSLENTDWLQHSLWLSWPEGSPLGLPRGLTTL